VRGAEAARKLRALGVKGTLIKAAELGYITEVTCGMPKCFCPEELGGASHFVARTQTWNDWEPTHEHFPIPKLIQFVQQRKLGPVGHPDAEEVGFLHQRGCGDILRRAG
jgi:hypothetical protein